MLYLTRQKSHLLSVGKVEKIDAGADLIFLVLRDILDPNFFSKVNDKRDMAIL